MDWNQMEGEWERMKGLARERWAKFTEEDLREIAGDRDRLIAKLQEKYAISKDEAFRRAEEWLRNHRRAPTTSQTASRQ